MRLNLAIVSCFSSAATTLYVQVADQPVLRKTIVHLIPRNQNDLPNNDQIYRLFEVYPKELLKFNQEASQTIKL